MTPEELFGEIPIGLPMTHQVYQDIMPGIAKYPVDQWAAMGEPTFTVMSWIKLCVKVATNDLTNLGSVMEVAEKLAAKM